MRPSLPQNFSKLLDSENDEICDQELVLGKEVVDKKWVSVKSNGFLGTGIVDDAEACYKPNPIGDIPAQCAKKIHIKIEPPADLVIVVAWAMLIILFDVE